MSTIALHIIAKDEAQELKRIILDYHKYFDQIDIAIDDDHCLEMTQLVVNKLNDCHVNLYKYEWDEEEKKRGFPSFDKKRNFLVSKCKCDFYLRLDTDDEILKPELIQGIVDKADRDGVDIVSCYYDYSRDQFGNTHAAHYRETIVRNNNNYYWNKKIHENILPKYAKRRVPIIIDKTLVIKHNISPEHAIISKNRNFKFLLEEYEQTQDNPDPRTLAYLGRMLYPMGKLKEAKYFLEEHIKKSGWDEDRCMSWCYLAKVMEDLGNLDQALACCYEAINERPDFPDGYLAMHQVYFSKGEWAKAVHWGEIGLKTKRPDTFMLSDPASYTWRPAMTMAHAELMLGKPERANEYFQIVKKYAPELDWVKDNESVFDEALITKQYVKNFSWMLHLLKEKDPSKMSKMFDVIPKNLERHELLVGMRHQFTEPKVWKDNEIAIYCGQSWEDWAAPSVLKGVGGSEEAVIYMSKELTKLGYKVTVFCSCGDLKGTYDGVEYKDFFEFNPRDEFSNVIAWRGNIFGSIKVKRAIVWLHDVPVEGMFVEQAKNTFDRVIVLSKYHASLLPDYIDKNKVYISSNGINVKDFKLKDKPKRNPKRMIYTSSYDRGIENLLDMWADIKKEVPDAELHLFYGWDVYDSMVKKGFRSPELKNRIVSKMNQPGIFDHGRVSHNKLIKELYKSGLFVYPSHFQEISCISAMKAQECGCVPVTTDFAALAETVKTGVMVCGKAGTYSVNEQYKDALIKMLKDVDLQESWRKRVINKNYDFSWKAVAESWVKDLLTKDLQHQNFKDIDDYKLEYSKAGDEFKPPNFSEDLKPIPVNRFMGALELCEEKKAKTMIDVGCSDGALCFLAGDKGIKADGIEICPKCVSFAKKYAKDNGYDCEFTRGILEEVDINKKYDVVSCQEVIEHVLDPKSFIKKLNTLGKYVYITTPHKDGIWGEKNRDPHHLWHFDEDSLRELIGDKKIIALERVFSGNVLVAVYEND